MKAQTIFDLEYNIAALYIAILREDIFLPEQAFAAIEGERYRLTYEDTLDMIAMKEQGLSYAKIGGIYGLDPSSVFRRFESIKKKGERLNENYKSRQRARENY